MAFAPSSSVSTNDLFNSGYGEFATFACVVCFSVTFIYYTVANTRSNLGKRYLSPVGDDGGGNCELVPLEITNRYLMDLNGSWDSNQKFLFSEAAYRLELNGVKFTDGNASYTKQIKDFEADFRNKSSRGADRDFAWNLMFASSYSETSYENDGAASMFVNSDARIIYDQPVWGGGFANLWGSCNPDGATFSYDSNKGSLVMEVLGISPDPNIAWNPCSDASYYYMYDTANDLNYDAYKKPTSYRLEINVASVTTAIAINQGLAKLSSLTPVLGGTNPLYRSYIDDFYAPMQPIQCIHPSEWLPANTTWPYPTDDLCLVHAQNMWMLPVTTHTGTYKSNCWMPQMCTCDDGARDAPGTGCNAMDIGISFIFVPYTYWYYEDGAMVCQDTTITAATNAISNAFASASLYTAVLMVIVLGLIVSSHNYLYPEDELIPADANAVRARGGGHGHKTYPTTTPYAMTEKEEEHEVEMTNTTKTKGSGHHVAVVVSANEVIEDLD
eukprot:gene36477-44989_t